MNLPILIGVVVVLIAVRFAKPNMLMWLILWWAGVFVGVRYGIEPPMPSSIVNLFMGITSVALLTYVFSDSTRLANTRDPLVRFLVDRKYTIPLSIIVLALPGLVGLNVYKGMSQAIEPPVSSRTIHPAPPEAITFKGKNIDLIAGENPYRALEESDPAAFKTHVTNGRRVYYQNCVFCHGDNMEGDGIFSHALDPIPANLNDATTIGMLQESYLFWRIAKGAPGLPEESTPWGSAMPAWEQFLSEEEIWEVILFLYDHTGLKPREREMVH
jgi:mono/diheme cytochrome c family protein